MEKDYGFMVQFLWMVEDKAAYFHLIKLPWLSPHGQQMFFLTSKADLTECTGGDEVMWSKGQLERLLKLLRRG